MSQFKPLKAARNLALGVFLMGLASKSSAQMFCPGVGNYEEPPEKGVALLTSVSYTALFGPTVYTQKQIQLNAEGRYYFNSDFMSPYAGISAELPVGGDPGSERKQAVIQNDNGEKKFNTRINLGVSFQNATGEGTFSVSQNFPLYRLNGKNSLKSFTSAELGLMWKAADVFFGFTVGGEFNKNAIKVTASGEEKLSKPMFFKVHFGYKFKHKS